MHARHHRHALHRAVAGRARHAVADVRAVIEVHERGQVVHAPPLDARALRVALAQRRQQRRLGKQLGVAVHADLRSRDAGEGAALDGVMTVAAIDSVLVDVVLVTEGQRLRNRRTLRVGVAGEPAPHQHHARDQHQEEQQREPERQNRATTKKLRHVSGNSDDDAHGRRCKLGAATWRDGDNSEDGAFFATHAWRRQRTGMQLVRGALKLCLRGASPVAGCADARSIRRPTPRSTRRSSRRELLCRRKPLRRSHRSLAGSHAIPTIYSRQARSVTAVDAARIAYGFPWRLAEARRPRAMGAATLRTARRKPPAARGPRPAP
jgi:hypothetical protein